MKKTLILTVILAGIIACAFWLADGQYRTSLGRTAPCLWLPTDSGAINFEQKRGHYVLLNFWCSTDAPSREAANIYTAWLRQHPGTVDLVSVNLDDSQPLFDQIVRQDRLIPDTQYHADGDMARAIINSYQLDQGLGSMLIDPNGKIIAHNPTTEALGEAIEN